MTNNTDNIIEPLNPADSFTLAMDEEIRNDGLAGSYGCFALELSDIPDLAELERRIDAFAKQFPVVQGCLQQRGRRYYWCQRPSPPQLFFQHNANDSKEQGDDLHQITLAIVNKQEQRDTLTPIEFHLILSPNTQTFFMRWIHPICDARGAGLILNYLCEEADRQKYTQSEPLIFVQLRKFRWWQKIGLLIKGKRYIDQLDQLKSIQALECHATPKQLNYRIKKLSVEDSNQISQIARKQTGLTGTSLYYIGCFMRALATVFPDQPGEAYCTPYAFNLRKQNALGPVTGNHICALFAQAPREVVNDRLQLFAHLKQQYTNVIRNQQDFAFLPLMWAGSWLSLKEYGKTLRLSYGSGEERSSFWFSDIGRVVMPENGFLGAQVIGVFHVCQVSTPPGIAFLTCIYQGQLTLSYNFVEPVCQPEWIEQLHQQVVQELLTEDV